MQEILKLLLTSKNIYFSVINAHVFELVQTDFRILSLCFICHEAVIAEVRQIVENTIEGHADVGCTYWRSAGDGTYHAELSFGGLLDEVLGSLEDTPFVDSAIEETDIVVTVHKEDL